MIKIGKQFRNRYCIICDKLDIINMKIVMKYLL